MPIRGRIITSYTFRFASRDGHHAMEKLLSHFCTRRCTTRTHYDKRTFVFSKIQGKKKQEKKPTRNSRVRYNPITHLWIYHVDVVLTTASSTVTQRKPGT